jgi:multidrug efflux pump
VNLDRDKIASYGLTMGDVGGAMSSMLGGGYVNYFSLSGRAYQVVPQVERDARLNPSQLSSYYIKNAAGTTIPLGAVATFSTQVVPESLNHFQQQNAATIQAVPKPGVTTGEALQKLQDIATKAMPAGYHLDYGGMTRQQVQESSSLTETFFFALIIIFLVLAALFESFRDPFTILIAVPMSIFGALLFITLGFGGASLNIYTEVGLVTLIGLISKHGILIVRFANDLAGARFVQAPGDRGRGRDPLAPDPDDHRRHGARRHAADPGVGRRRGGAVQPRPGGRLGPVDRHAVHPVRGAVGLSS